MVDLSNLQLVPEEITNVADEASYVDAQEFAPPIPEGTYTLIQGKATPDVTKGNNPGKLKLKFDPHVVSGGEQDGQKLMFDEVSETTFERGGVGGMSTMKDHVRALYPPNSPERNARSRGEQADAIIAAEGKSFKAAVEWDGYCGHKDTEFATKDGGPQAKPGVSVKRQKNFPNGGDVKCSTCGGAIRPRARISRRIAAE